MRLIQVMVPSGKRDDVISYLNEQEFDFAVTDETSGREYSDVVSFPVQTENVEEVLDSLRSIGIETEGYVIVSEAQAVVSEKFEERSEESDEEDEEEGDSERIARDELRATAEGLSRSTRNYVIFTVISAVVATAGLMTDSASIVVGSMVIAPLIGPAMASSVGSVIKDDDLFFEGVKSQFVGVGVAVLSATVFAVLARLVVAPELELRLIDQVAERINPGVLSLAVALGSGVAGAVSLTSGMSAALVGVMIAVALIPPAATIGLGVAYLDLAIVASATVLVLVNLLSINLGGLVTLWIKGYRPQKWYEEKEARQVTLKRVAALVLGILLLTTFLVATTYDARQNAVFENQVEQIVRDVGGSTAEVEFSYDNGFVFRSPQKVTVRMDADSTDVARILRQRILRKTGESVTVVVVDERIIRSR